MAATALAAVVLVVALCGAAAAAPAGVVVETTTTTLSSTAGGTHTATVSLLNSTTGAVQVAAAIPGDAGCVVTSDPAKLPAGSRSDVTLFLGSGCDTTKGATITLSYVPPVPPNGAVKVKPSPGDKARWDILGYSFAVALGIAALLVAFLCARMWWHNDHSLLPPRTRTGTAPDPPTLAVGDPGPILPGAYAYAVTFVTEDGESPFSTHESIVLRDKRQVKVTLPHPNSGTRARRIYREDRKKGFRRVGEVTDPEQMAYVDVWAPLGRNTQLAGLGPNWSLKDNWIGNVTVTAAALVGLLAASNVLQAVLGSQPEAALGVIAVGGALSAVFVGLGPLIVKMIGKDLSVPTAGGMLFAALVTLFGAMGQIVVVTWQASELATTAWAQGAIAVVAAATSLVILWYSGASLWYYVEFGARFKPEPKPDVITAADAVVDAIKRLSPRDLAKDDEHEPEPARLVPYFVAQKAAGEIPFGTNALL